MFHNRRAARPRLCDDFQQRASGCNQLAEGLPGKRAPTCAEEVLGRRIDEADLVFPSDDQKRQRQSHRDVGGRFLVGNVSGCEQ